MVLLGGFNRLSRPQIMQIPGRQAAGPPGINGGRKVRSTFHKIQEEVLMKIAYLLVIYHSN
jgi:hypothetical protein